MLPVTPHAFGVARILLSPSPGCRSAASFHSSTPCPLFSLAPCHRPLSSRRAWPCSLPALDAYTFGLSFTLFLRIARAALVGGSPHAARRPARVEQIRDHARTGGWRRDAETVKQPWPEDRSQHKTWSPTVRPRWYFPRTSTYMYPRSAMPTPNKSLLHTRGQENCA